MSEDREQVEAGQVWEHSGGGRYVVYGLGGGRVAIRRPGRDYGAWIWRDYLLANFKLVVTHA